MNVKIILEFFIILVFIRFAFCFKKEDDLFINKVLFQIKRDIKSIGKYKNKFRIIYSINITYFNNCNSLCQTSLKEFIFKVDFSSTQLLITEPILNFSSIKEGMREIFFEEYGFEGFIRLPGFLLFCFKAF
jgi:hypothetical protein